MKRYIKCGVSQADDAIHMSIDVEYYLVDNEEDLSISAGIDYPENPAVEYDVVGTVLDNFASVVATIKNLFETYGFMSMEEYPSNGSKSIYIKFCYEGEYDVQEVEVVFSMRISDHRVPMQRRHNSHEEAEKHMESKHQQYVDKNYLWLNSRLEELEQQVKNGQIDISDVELHIPLAMSFITLNERQMSSMTALRDRIKRELIALKHDNPPAK